jgi:hypothetical protein
LHLEEHRQLIGHHVWTDGGIVIAELECQQVSHERQKQQRHRLTRHFIRNDLRRVLAPERDLRLLAAIEGEGRRGERLAGRGDDAAVALVEPLGRDAGARAREHLRRAAVAVGLAGDAGGEIRVQRARVAEPEAAVCGEVWLLVVHAFGVVGGGGTSQAELPHLLPDDAVRSIGADDERAGV